MLATSSTGQISLDELSNRLTAMVAVLLQNSMAIDFLPAGYIELHWGGKEVHGKVHGRLNTDDRQQ